MSNNLNKVRAKEIKKTRKGKTYLVIGLIAIILLAVTLTLAYATLSDKPLLGNSSNPIEIDSAPIEINSEGNLQIIRVPAGGNLQEAINKAQGGDIIELQAGATYYGEIKLPKKTITDYITVQTSAVKQLPENQRVNPSQAKLMAKIVSRGKGASALKTENGSHHFRFIGIEFSPSNDDYIYNLVYLGNSEENNKEIPHSFEFDRCYFRSYKIGVTRRGVALNSASTTIKNSYFEGFAFPQEETQGICGWTGTKNVRIINNYIEGGAENIMFGGASPLSADLIPTNIEITGNHLNKPADWKNKNSMKCLFELKNAKNVTFTKNYLENNWLGGAFRITVRNETAGAPFSTIEDVLIQDNIINGAGDGINILGKDDVHPSQILKRLTITNNLLLNIGGQGFEGSGYFIQINDGEDILIANNTSLNQGHIATIYGKMPRNFLFRDNIVGFGDYGIHSENEITAQDWQSSFINNVFVNVKNLSNMKIPNRNFRVQNFQSIGFIDYAKKDFRLSPNSPFKNKGKDKSDIGSNLTMNSILP